MRVTRQAAVQRLEDRLGDAVRALHDGASFISSWAADPLRTGAISPSSPELAAAMAREIDPATPGPVVELGPGTGVMTRALIARGFSPERLVLIEFNAKFCRRLAERYPGVTVIEGDAYALSRHVAARGLAPLAGVVSSLPLLTRAEPERRALVEAALDALTPGAPFVQFTYSLFPPVGRSPGYRVEGRERIWLNLPPARVWTYRRPA